MNPGRVPFDTADVVARRRVHQSRDSLPNLLAALGEALASLRVLLVTRPATNDPAAVLQFCRDNRPRQLERTRFVSHRLEESRAKVDVAVGRSVHVETDGTAPAQGGDAYAPAYTCIQCLHGDLCPAQYDYGVDRLERDASVPFGRRNHQRTAPVLDPSAVVANVQGAQIAHPNTTLDRYRRTLCVELASSGKQWCKSWHSLHRSSFTAAGNSPVRSCRRMVSMATST